MATRPTYCTERDLKDVFPHIDEFDSKTPIYGWSSVTLDGNTYYVAYNSGLVTNLYINGKSQESGQQSIATTASTAINVLSPYSTTDTSIVVDDGSALTDATYIKIRSEVLGITNISTNTLTVTRGELGTTPATISNNTEVFKHFQPSANGDNLYDSNNDFIILKYASNPIDLLMEAGVDWATLKTRYMGNASRFLDSRLDPKLPRERIKDKDGNYDYIIIRSTALITAVFLIRSHDPNSEIAKAMMDEVDGNIASLNGGEATLSWQVTQDSSHGIIREVGSPTAGLRPVDTRGEWSGTWDLLKLKITLAGAIGTAKYSVWTKDSTSGLKSNQVVTDEIITGDYQALSGGLQIRFQGTDDSATATLNDEWEVEVMGREEIADTGVRSVRNTRGS